MEPGGGVLRRQPCHLPERGDSVEDLLSGHLIQDCYPDLLLGFSALNLFLGLHLLNLDKSPRHLTLPCSAANTGSAPSRRRRHRHRSGYSAPAASAKTPILAAPRSWR